jgi:hypothetical protein
MTKTHMFVLTLIATVMVSAAGPAQTQQQAPEVAYPPPLSYPRLQYYQQHPDEFQQLLRSLPPVSHEIVPGKVLAPGEPPSGGNWYSLNNPLKVNGQPVNLSNPILLTDGTVIAHVTCTGSWYKFTPDNFGSYINGTWSAIASLPSGYAPRFFGSAVLPDGRVIIEGGEYNGSQCQNVFTTLGAIYDPVANTWTAVNPPSGWATIGDAAGIVLANGNYMQTSCCDNPPRAALLNPGNLTWTTTGAGKFDVYDEESMALQWDGSVLTVDAYVTNGPCGRGSEKYNVVAGVGTWSSAGTVPNQQSDCTSGGQKTNEVGPLVNRLDGSSVTFSGTTIGAAGTAIYINGWSAGPNVPSVNGIPYTLADAPAVVMPNNNVLFAASPSNWTNPNQFPAPTHYFEMSGVDNSITQVADKADWAGFNSFQQNFLMLPDGQVMAFTIDGPTVQLYTPTDNANPNWVPSFISYPTCVIRGSTYTASGRQLNGLTEGAYYGDDTNASTNFPLIRIQNNATGHVSYARTFNHSSRSIAPNAIVSTRFKVAANTEVGPSTLFAVANGIRSAGQPITVRTDSCPSGVATATHDFNADGYSDIAWRQNTGGLAIWQMFGGWVGPSVAYSVPTNWRLVGQRDFDGNGTSDLLWRDDNTGMVAMWFMNGLKATAKNVGQVPTNWQIVGTGDFSGDGYGDILWFDNISRTLGIWAMNGVHPIKKVNFGKLATGWIIAGTGDFNRDGTTDILWRNISNGAVAVSLVSNLSVGTPVYVASLPVNWQIVGTGDFNGDGYTDILWRDGSTGVLRIWLMQGTTVIQDVNLGPLPSNWYIAATGDYDGDGTTDLLLSNNNNGGLVMWFVNLARVTGSVNLGTVTTDWTVDSTNAE